MLSNTYTCLFFLNNQVYLHLKWHFCVFLLSHSPDAADSSSFDVQLGDIILTATDGLFDNMPDYMILQELKKLKVPEHPWITLLCTFFVFQWH